jgi:hypothetical protein
MQAQSLPTVFVSAAISDAMLQAAPSTFNQKHLSSAEDNWKPRAPVRMTFSHAMADNMSFAARPVMIK